MSTSVFDVVPEHPEVKHVAGDVRDISVQEHGCEKPKVDTHSWDEAISVHDGLHTQRCEDLPQKDQYVCRNETPSDNRYDASRILIAKREHG